MPRFDPRLGPHIRAQIDYHRAHPEVSFAQHLAALEEDTARDALGRTRIYLDLRYWIFLRDANLGRPQKPVHAKLLDLTLACVAAGKIVCPITEVVFFELDRQGNTERRMQTVRMIDKLSHGLVIKNYCERYFWELHDLFDAVVRRQRLPEGPSRRVWVRPYSFLGTPRVSGLADALGAADELTLNKAFLSFTWTQSLEDLLTDTPVPDDRGGDDEFRKTGGRITELSAKHAPEMRSFTKVFEDEVAGLIQAHRDEICQVFRLYASALFRQECLPDCDPSIIDRGGLTVLYSVATDPKAHRAVPLIRIMAGLHAFIRWQRQRSFQFQDFFDLRHAAAAIPYCDIFLTEKFLKTACTSGLLDYGNKYGTQIISDEDEAIEAIARAAGI
jgi:hypothetical protein